MARLKNFSKSGILNVLFQVIFLLILYFVGSKACLSMEGAGRNILLLIIVLIPSAIWTFILLFSGPNRTRTRLLRSRLISGGDGRCSLAHSASREIHFQDR